MYYDDYLLSIIEIIILKKKKLAPTLIWYFTALNTVSLENKQIP